MPTNYAFFLHIVKTTTKLVKKTYSKLCDDFRLNKFTNLAIAVSIGHTSHATFEECLSRCFSNFDLELKIKSHCSQ